MRKIKEIFNFDNIGQKIKNFVKWCCWITILLVWVACPIAFIVLLSEGSPPEGYLIVIVVAAIVPVVVWISAWPLYALGELVHRACNIDSNTSTGGIKSSVQSQAEQKKIDKLESLRAKGLITEAEFIAAITEVSNVND